MNAEQLKGHLEPMVLAVLEAGPAHGYAILDALRDRSAGVFDIPEGSLYPALHRLERAGTVMSSREIVNGRERRVYRLSRRGRTALQRDRLQWAAFSGAVDRVLGPVPS